MTEEVLVQETEASHEAPLYAEGVFRLGNFQITNSLLLSLVALILIGIFAISFKKKIREIPGKMQSAFEMFMEALFEMFDSVTGSRQKTLKFTPLVLSFFIFILINNYLGLLPGVGSIGGMAIENGEEVFVPLFRGATADLNTTLALAIVGVLLSHFLGVKELGAWNHVNKFINLKAIIEIPKKIIKDPAIIFVNLVKFVIGLIEIVGELSKMASLSLRLFGNIFAGEVLLTAMAAIMAYGTPIPFIFLEILVGLVQAFVFSILVLTYLNINTSAEEH